MINESTSGKYLSMKFAIYFLVFTGFAYLFEKDWSVALWHGAAYATIILLFNFAAIMWLKRRKQS